MNGKSRMHCVIEHEIISKYAKGVGLRYIKDIHH